ncbi:MAG: phosphonate ABC transporter ATP-binding protein [Ferrovibrio sp.]|uniref:phosphonate ABC transporter ATP-binding protein n=1 Tax=Ferrovibrio sp. TaxID=1917215 RepID=UPI003918A845
MLRISNLTKRFGAVVAVNDITLDIPDGQMIAVIGRSGAGKSTMLRMINRLAEPSGGSIYYNGTDIVSLRGPALREWRSQAAMIFQGFNLAPRLDVLTNVLVGASTRVPQYRRLFKLYSDNERMQAATVLDDLGLLDKAMQRAERLSGGQQQRVAIARALLQEPRLVLADEPIASLDPHNAATVMDALKRINTERGISVICNLHSIEIARQYADRVIGLRDGTLVFDAPLHQLTDTAIANIYGGDVPVESEPAMAAA